MSSDVGMSAERLKRLLGDFENSYVERKPFGDKEGWLRTIVAFANSCPLEDEAVLFIGATDDGLVQVKPGEDLDKLQRTLSERVLAQVYPRVRVRCIPLRMGEAICLAVVVPEVATGRTSRGHLMSEMGRPACLRRMSSFKGSSWNATANGTRF